ncbi:MAG: oligosaccharide flippase family protein [Candidatus Riflebacteria bacterium]|nr:oligosaccharide flippase family protein [Candidatus Riflebacteria bacterium]
MATIKKNIVANVFGNIWVGLVSLIFVPLYIDFLGIESYGLVGIYATLIVLFSVLELGLSSTLNRELAKLSVDKDNLVEMRDLLRTLEIIYWIIAAIISVIVIILSDYIAFKWVNLKTLSPDTVRYAIMVMGVAIGFQWPLALYGGGLMGLQNQVTLNYINIGAATFRSAGAAAVLWLVSPTIGTFFLWQIITSILHTGTVAFFLWKSLSGNARKPIFRLDLLKNIWKFAAGLSGISILATILMQIDKIIISRMLSLEMFGYYMFTNTIAMSLHRLIGPVFYAVFPKFTTLLAVNAREELIRLYHLSSQTVSAIALPIASILAFFSSEVILLWTKNPVNAANSSAILSVLVIGTSLNCLMNVPYALQLAAGWTKLPFMVNLFMTFLIVPLSIILTRLYGPIGSASAWVILNSTYIIITIQIMHTRLLNTEKWKWYIMDIILPAMAAFSIAGIIRLIPFPAGRLTGVIFLLGAYCITLAATVAASRKIRTLIIQKLTYIIQNKYRGA